jgi:hypothetical protein
MRLTQKRLLQKLAHFFGEIQNLVALHTSQLNLQCVACPVWVGHTSLEKISSAQIDQSINRRRLLDAHQTSTETISYEDLLGLCSRLVANREALLIHKACDQYLTLGTPTLDIDWLT